MGMFWVSLEGTVTAVQCEAVGVLFCFSSNSGDMSRFALFKPHSYILYIYKYVCILYFCAVIFSLLRFNFIQINLLM